MKKLFPLLIFLCMLCSAISAQVLMGRIDTDCAAITLNPDTLNFGKITLNTEVLKKITVRNSGKCPLIIYSINAPYAHEYICNKTFYLPGDTGVITVYYYANKEGPVMHFLDIYSNAIPDKHLYVKGEVATESICGKLAFDKDTLNLGDIPYLFGKHYNLNVYNKGICNMTFSVPPRDDYLYVLDYTKTPVKPGDTGKVEIHLGGQVTGNYYGKLTVVSKNSAPEINTLFLKARFLPPPKADSTDTEIKVSTDRFDFGTIYAPDLSTDTNKRKEWVKAMKVKLKVTNTGKKPLKLEQSPSDPMNQMPDKPIMPGKSVTIYTTFYASGTPFEGDPLVIQYNTLSGNFAGKNMFIYGIWNFKKELKVKN